MKATKNKKMMPAKTQKSAAKKSVPVKKQASAGQDIVKLILEDHKPLKKLIKILKDSEKHDLDERQEAFEEFAPLLVNHSKPEEQSLYVFMKDEDELREEGFEGDVEHALADQLLEEIKRTDDEDLWSARVKVLAELVEHHIEEEESELLPDFKKHSEVEDRMELGANFLRLKSEIESEGGRDTVVESTREIRANH
jgi:hemerythrin superfamily protein